MTRPNLNFYVNFHSVFPKESSSFRYTEINDHFLIIETECMQFRATRYICNRPGLADAFAKRMHSRLCVLRILAATCLLVHLSPSQAKHSGHCLRDCLLIRHRGAGVPHFWNAVLAPGRCSPFQRKIDKLSSRSEIDFFQFFFTSRFNGDCDKILSKCSKVTFLLLISLCLLSFYC